jgi:Ca2+-transporting ATPase
MPTKDEGLTSAEAKARLVEYGKNELPEKPPPSDFSLFISQLKNPLVYILMAAGTVTVFLGHYSDAAIILFAVVVNTTLGFIQERRASRALTALKKLIHPHAKVKRDGEVVTIDVEEVVPGDVVVLEQGSKVPADGTLLVAERLFVEEAILTGESVPVEKEEKKEVFMGTIVTAGHGLMRVTTTGEGTQMGKIAKGIQEPSEDTPLRIQLKRLAKQLSILVFGLTVIVFLVGVISGREIAEMFTTAVALSVSAIPEGLLVGLTVVLAIGMQRILKKKGLVRNLVSAETLGGVTTICVDKTGTLTEGKMQVVDTIGDEKMIAQQAVLANDLDDPLVIAAYEWAKQHVKNLQSLVEKNPRLDSIPFSSKSRFFAGLNQTGKEKTLFVNGAPEFLLEWSDLTRSQKSEIGGRIEELTSQGKRVIGLAKKTFKKERISGDDVKKGLKWVGALAFSDPVRQGVKTALEKTESAGINLIIITGDYAQTAIAVMGQIGFEVDQNEVILGEKLSALSSHELAKRLSHPDGETKLFARTTPEQKLKIVEALKANGEVVAMMGDGVNDAPALKKADIGIVVGEASDVAKETADLILLDSNFATIIEAIEEGRGIFDNIRKIILYLMSDAFEEIIAVIGTLVLGLPLPITAGQVLWINLISDGFPDLALTIDPKSPGIMKQPPRDSAENIISLWMRNLIALVSLAGGLMALGLFVWFHAQTGDDLLARSIAFATLGLNSLVYVFSIRTLTRPFWKENPFDNKWLNLAVLAGFGLQITPFFIPTARNFLRLESLSLGQWGMVAATSIVMFIIIEVAKEIFRVHLAHKKVQK